jgi:hypothetical protein
MPRASSISSALKWRSSRVSMRRMRPCGRPL